MYQLVTNICPKSKLESTLHSDDIPIQFNRPSVGPFSFFGLCLFHTSRLQHIVEQDNQLYLTYYFHQLLLGIYIALPHSLLFGTVHKVINNNTTTRSGLNIHHPSDRTQTRCFEHRDLACDAMVAFIEDTVVMHGLWQATDLCTFHLPTFPFWISLSFFLLRFYPPGATLFYSCVSFLFLYEPKGSRGGQPPHYFSTAFFCLVVAGVLGASGFLFVLWTTMSHRMECLSQEDVYMRRKDKGVAKTMRRDGIHKRTLSLPSWGHHTSHHFDMCALSLFPFPLYALSLSLLLALSVPFLTRPLPLRFLFLVPPPAFCHRMGSNKKQIREGKGKDTGSTKLVLCKDWNEQEERQIDIQRREKERERVHYVGRWVKGHGCTASEPTSEPLLLFFGFISNTSRCGCQRAPFAYFWRTARQRELTICKKNFQRRATGSNWDPFPPKWHSWPLSSYTTIINHLSFNGTWFHLGHLSFIELFYLQTKFFISIQYGWRQYTLPPCHPLLPYPFPLPLSSISVLPNRTHLLPFAFDPFSSNPYLQNPVRTLFLFYLGKEHLGVHSLRWLFIFICWRKEFSFWVRQEMTTLVVNNGGATWKRQKKTRIGCFHWKTKQTKDTGRSGWKGVHWCLFWVVPGPFFLSFFLSFLPFSLLPFCRCHCRCCCWLLFCARKTSFISLSLLPPCQPVYAWRWGERRGGKGIATP